MALLSRLFDEVRPWRIHNQLFDMDTSQEGFLTDVLESPSLQIRRYIRPWKNLSALARDVGSTIKVDKDKFLVNLDVQHFHPEDITVKTADRYIIIEGKHDERKDEHGFVSREFKRKYLLPKDCNAETVESKLSADGVLTVTASKFSDLKDERAIPTTHTGPVRLRRKAIDEEEKSPQKKRRR